METSRQKNFLLEDLRLKGQQSKKGGRGGGTTFNHSLPPDTTLTLAITAESSPPHILSKRTQTGNLWFSSASH